MATGSVKWFHLTKGYGFILPDGGGRDVFVHRNNVESLEWNEALREGERVVFEIEKTPKGLNATNVKRAP